MNLIIKHLLGIIIFTLSISFLNTLYGSTCGISIYKPQSWLYTFMLVGSPWCSRLGSLTVWLTRALENLWLISFGLIMTTVISYLPEQSRKIFNSVPVASIETPVAETISAEIKK